MANITRKHHKIFASSATNNGQFGSAQLGTKINSNDPDVIQALSAYDQGWNSATTGGTELPTLEEMQGLQYNNSYQIAYLLQKGIPEWNTSTDYHIGDIAREIAGTKFYKSITDNNIGNALTDINNWEFLGNFGLATTTTQGISYLDKPITIANNATDADHDIDFGAGNFNFDDGSGQATLSALTKQFDSTFALGTNAGGMVSGESLPTSGAVYLYQISNASGTITDIIGTTTADGSTISGDPVVSANSLTKKELLHTLITNSSANIYAGTWYSNGTFVYAAPPILVSSLAGSGSVSGLIPALPCRVFVSMHLQTSGAGHSNFYVRGSLETATDYSYVSTIGTNNGFAIDGTGVAHSANGILYYGNFTIAGGVSHQSSRVRAYQLINL